MVAKPGLVWIVAVALMSGGCKREATRQDRTPQPGSLTGTAPSGGQAMSKLEIRTSAFGENERVPRKHTGDGANVSPPLAWTGAPEGTQQFALIVDDPDAPRAEPWVHWLLYRIPAETTQLPEGVPPSEHVSDPGGAVQGRNSWNKIGYGGPEPPKGHGVHHYHFKLYALDAKLELPPGADKAALLKAIKGHVLAEGELVGTYER